MSLDVWRIISSRIITHCYRIARFDEGSWTTTETLAYSQTSIISWDWGRREQNIKRAWTLLLAPSLRSSERKQRIVNRLGHNRRRTWVKWVWLYAVDHVFVALKNHHQFSAVLVPNKDAPTITAAENILLTPEISFLDLQRDIIHLMYGPEGKQN